MPKITVQGVESGYSLVRKGENGLLYAETVCGSRKFEVVEGDTFHLSYSTEFTLTELLLAWLFNTPLVPKVMTQCRCAWAREVNR